MAAISSGSLVSNILKKAATLDDAYLEDSISKVEKKCTDLREEVLQFLKQNYDEFTAQADSTISLEERIKELTVEFKRISTRVEGDLKGRLIKSAGKKEELETQLNETETRIKFVENLVQIYTNLEQCEVFTTRKQYTSASKLVLETTDLLSQIRRDGCDAKVCSSLKNQLALVTSNLKFQLQEDWNVFVKWKPAMPTQELSLNAALDVKLTVPNASRVPEFEDLNKSMSYLFTEGEMEGRGKKFATKLLDAFVKPLLKHNTLEITITTVDRSSVIGLKSSSATRSFKSCITSIIDLTTTVYNMAPESYRGEWMPLLGKTIEPDFTPLFLKHVLSERIPKTEAERLQFSDTSSLITSLQGKLKKTCLVEESYSALTDYTVNVDTHVTMQQCQNILDKARKLLMQPIHNTVKTNEDESLVPLKKLNIGGSFVTGEKQMRLTGSVDEIDISSLTFAFPPCLISKSVKQFIALLHDTLICCTKTPSDTCMQLYYVSRDMVELFIAVSKAHHHKTASDVPRNAMTQHNNFMYVAHNLLTVGHQFHARIKCLKNVSFIDFVPRLRRLAEEYFLSEMERQSNNILECLSSFKSFDGVYDRQDEFERAIRQSILLIFNLSKVYSETLHKELFRRCQGGLLNVLVNELITRTLSLVDMASDDANALNNSFEAEIVKKAPVALSLTIEEEKELLPKICQNWEKLGELIFVLDATQNDIVNRWANGKGSLAKHMSVAETKQLVRAIFKNTERRANTLSKII